MAWEWLTKRHPPDPDPAAVARADPDPAFPRAAPGELRVTWVGHSTLLIQLPGLTLLTDPVWSERVSPVRYFGSRRFVPALPSLERLPPVDAVLLSHDHYDHLDRPTVRALHERFGSDLTWFSPPGYRSWLGAQGAERVVELDWWDRAPLPGCGYEVYAVPARHWTKRTPWGTNARLWCSWVVLPAAGDLEGGAPEAFRVYIGGDSGAGRFFDEIGSRFGPFDLSILPIGAYDPRWFMHAVHMDPEEAVMAYLQLGGQGAFIPCHWGTFRLTFEAPLEPPARLRAAWERAALPKEALRVPRHGETVTLRRHPRA